MALAKRFSLLLGLGLILACQQPVVHKENAFTVSKSSINQTCTVLKQAFPDYSCREFYHETYTLNRKPEKIGITLNRKKLQLTYHTNDKNGPLYEQYEQVINALKGEKEPEEKKR